MTYTIQDAIVDWHDEVMTALHKQDSEALYKLAQLVDEDEAQPLLDTIKRWENEDWAYDRAVDNSL